MQYLARMHRYAYITTYNSVLFVALQMVGSTWLHSRTLSATKWRPVISDVEAGHTKRRSRLPLLKFHMCTLPSPPAVTRRRSCASNIITVNGALPCAPPKAPSRAPVAGSHMQMLPHSSPLSTYIGPLRWTRAALQDRFRQPAKRSWVPKLLCYLAVLLSVTSEQGS